jgi:hypothetical protein
MRPELISSSATSHPSSLVDQRFSLAGAAFV